MSNDHSPDGSEPTALHPSMTVREFDDGYYYAADLKKFAWKLGIPTGTHRKIELEQLIRG